jgi:hypothetical protein
MEDQQHSIEELRRILRLMHYHGVLLASMKNLLIKRGVFSVDELTNEMDSIEETMRATHERMRQLAKQDNLLEGLDSPDTPKM